MQRDSANGQFGPPVPKIGLLADHHKLVKFAKSDRVYDGDVKDRITEIVHGALDACEKKYEQKKKFVAIHEQESAIGRPSLLMLGDAQRKSTHVIPTVMGLKSMQGNSPAPFSLLDNSRPKPEVLDPAAANAWVSETIREMRWNQYTPRIDSIDKECFGTCDWIFSKTEYRKWNDLRKNSIIFIQGGPGYGKSVLARFLVQRLKNGDGAQGERLSSNAAEQNRRPIVAHSFCRGTESTDADRSPTAILQNVMFQILTEEPDTCRKAISDLYNRFNQSRSLDFYWDLFKAIKSTLTRNLYCIIDGLDKCIKASKNSRQSTVDERMEGFLKKLCETADESSSLERPVCTKILVTTRPTSEVRRATMGKDVLLETRESDTTSAVGEFVKAGVESLNQLKGLSPSAQDFIQNTVTQKSGHCFQTAATALALLRRSRYSLENQKVASDVLTKVNPQRCNDAYEEMLRDLQKAPPDDRLKASRIIRIIFFLQEEITLLALDHALPSSEDNLRPTPILGALDAFIRNNLALLVKIDERSIVSLQHQTVKEFLKKLSVPDLREYSCADNEGGHLHLALICIQHLKSRRHQVVTQEEIDRHEGNEEAARLDKSKFDWYASCYWDLHTKEAGNRINPHMSLVKQLLDTDDCYTAMLYSRWALGKDRQIWGLDFFPIQPISFLAANGLIDVLREHTVQRKEGERGLTRRLLFWRSRPGKDSGLKADFDLKPHADDHLRLTPLHYACSEGHLEVVEHLLNCGASGKVYDIDQQTPFSWAVARERKEIAEMLIERNQCWKPGGIVLTLHLACRHGMLGVVRHLLEDQYDVNARVFEGWTPIHGAVMADQTEILEFLLSNGGTPDSATEDGTTPLYCAAELGHLASIEILFHFKASMDPAPVRSDGRSPHHATALGGHLAVFQYLQRKCKYIKPDNDGYLPIHLAAASGHLFVINELSDKSNITSIDNNKQLPIHRAAARGHLDIVRKLFNLGQNFGIGVDVKCRDLSVTVEECPDDHITPLYLAVANGHQEIAEYLVGEKASLSVRSFRKQTLLHKAAGLGTSKMFKFLLQHGMDPYSINGSEETPLHLAATLGNRAIVETYLEMQNIDAYINAVDVDGESALTLAIISKNTQIAVDLISKGANVHLKSKYNVSSLMHSVDLKDTTVCKMLLEAGVDVNSTDICGETALHNAAENGNLDACDMLLARNAEVNKETYMIKTTPLHKAVERNHVDVAVRLLNAGADPLKREVCGACVFDYPTTYQPMSDLLKEYRKDYQPLSSCGQSDTLRKLFCDDLCAIPSTAPKDHNEAVQILVRWGNLAYVTWHLKDYDTLRTLLEIATYRSAELKLPAPSDCDDCRREGAAGSFWVCKQCHTNVICSECYENRSSGKYTRGCSIDHEYLELGGADWRRVEAGRVNAKGQTLWEWIQELKETHLNRYNTKSETTTDSARLPAGQEIGAL